MMTRMTHTLRRWRTTALWAAGTIVLIAGGISGYWYLTQTTSPLPPKIRAGLTFSPFVVPNDTKNYYTTDYTYITAEDNDPVLSYVVHTPNSSVTISERPQAPEFTEIPEYKDLWLTKAAQQYDTVQTSNGTIYLGRLDRQNNQQVGILLERGLTVFMFPDKELQPAQWRQLGDQLEIQKVIN